MSVHVGLSPAERCGARIDTRQAEIGLCFATQSPALGRAMAEAVLAPGKRFRGTLLLLSAEALGAAGPAQLDIACAVEFAHTASLIIDDLPAMDDARLRRGRATTHSTHGESRAILAGIALVSEALRLLAEAEGVAPDLRARLVAVLARAIGPNGLCAGQDMDLHDAKNATSILCEQDLKTGALFAAGFEMLALSLSLPAAQVAALSELGTLLGRVFQCCDDLLDVHGDVAGLGKDTGRDGDVRGVMAIDTPVEAGARYAALREHLWQRLDDCGLRGAAVADYVAEVLPEAHGG